MRRIIVLILVLLLLLVFAGIGIAGSNVEVKPSGAKVINGDFMAPAGISPAAIEYAIASSS